MAVGSAVLPGAFGEVGQSVVSGHGPRKSVLCKGVWGWRPSGAGAGGQECHKRVLASRRTLVMSRSDDVEAGRLPEVA